METNQNQVTVTDEEIRDEAIEMMQIMSKTSLGASPTAFIAIFFIAAKWMQGKYTKIETKDAILK